METMQKPEDNNKYLKPSIESNFLSVLPLKNMVALPKSIIRVVVGRDVSVKAVDFALKKGLFCQSGDPELRTIIKIFLKGGQCLGKWNCKVVQ